MATTQKHLEIIADQLITGILAIGTYVLAGFAKVSIADTKRGQRYSYRVKVVRKRTERGGYAPAHGEGPWVVELRTVHGGAPLGYVGIGPFTGHLRFWTGASRHYQGRQYHHPAAAWYFRGLIHNATHGHEMPDFIQVWRSHHCGRCGQDLVSEFRHIGYGPICCGHLGIDSKAIFSRLSELGEADLNSRIAMVREMVYSDLSAADKTALRLLPGVAGEYARQHTDAA